MKQNMQNQRITELYIIVLFASIYTFQLDIGRSVFSLMLKRVLMTFMT